MCAGGEPPRGANLKEWIHLQNAGPGTNISPRLTHLWSVLELRAEGLFISLRSGITRARLPAQAHLQLPAPGHPHRPAGAQWRSRGDPAAPSEAGDRRHFTSQSGRGRGAVRGRKVPGSRESALSRDLGHRQVAPLWASASLMTLRDLGYTEGLRLQGPPDSGLTSSPASLLRTADTSHAPDPSVTVQNGRPSPARHLQP